MKYIYTQGPWKELNGYIFWDSKPTEITDRATLERLQREEGFRAVEEVPLTKETPDGEEVKEAPAETRVLKGKECGVCHKLIHKGWYFHQKFCKG